METRITDARHLGQNWDLHGSLCINCSAMIKLSQCRAFCLPSCATQPSTSAGSHQPECTLHTKGCDLPHVPTIRLLLNITELIVSCKMLPSALVTVIIMVGVYSVLLTFVTSAFQVLPRHRHSAAAAAEAMLNNPSPLSGLHKLALSICARKRSIPMHPLAPLPAGGAAEGGAGVAARGKENVTPPLQWQQADASGTCATLICL